MFTPPPETEISLFTEAARSWPHVKDTWEGIPADSYSLWLRGPTLKSLEPLLGLRRLRELVVSPLRFQELQLLSRLTKLRKLLLYDVRVKGLQPLETLHNLEYLSIFHGGTLISLSGFERLQRLRVLSIYHLPNVSSLEPLSSLVRLRELSIQSSMGTDKPLRFDSLSPIANLGDLEFLDLRGVQPRDSSLRPLARLKTLKYLAIGFNLPVKEYAYLATHLSPSVSDCLRPSISCDPDERTLVCKRCKRPLILLVGKSSARSCGLVCSQCNKTTLERHVRLFNEYVHSYRKGK
ncbi:MAG: hypothetical protein ABFC63_00535 [Thermoguttaceae bacterium]